MALYVYKRLRHPSSIRLIKYLSNDNADEISLSLSVHQLDSAPDYQAIRTFGEIQRKISWLSAMAISSKSLQVSSVHSNASAHGPECTSMGRCNLHQ